MKFRNLYSDPVRIVSESGSPDAVKTGWIRKDGEWKHVVKETYSIYELIQSSRDSVDLQRIVERYENGDSTALNRVQGSYFDLVNLPKNYSELFEAVNICNDTFDKLPIELKSKYHNSAHYFWSKVGTKELDDDINAFRSGIYNRAQKLDPQPLNTARDIERVMPVSTDNIKE